MELSFIVVVFLFFIKPESRKGGLDLSRRKRDWIVFSLSIVNLHVNQMWRGPTGGDLSKFSRKP